MVSLDVRGGADHARPWKQQLFTQIELTHPPGLSLNVASTEKTFMMFRIGLPVPGFICTLYFFFKSLIPLTQCLPFLRELKTRKVGDHIYLVHRVIHPYCLVLCLKYSRLRIIFVGQMGGWMDDRRVDGWTNIT